MKEKLSFSLPTSKSSSKSNNSVKPSQTFDQDSSTNQQQKQLITEFDPSKSQTLNPNPKTLIAPIENQWRPHKKMKNLDLPITDSHSSHSLTFEQDTSSISDQPADKSSYGLNLRPTTTDNSSNNKQQSDVVDEQRPRASVEVSMLQKFKEDMERLPADNGFDEYIDVPVDGFGAALLGGYGWKEGMGIGKNAKEDIKVVEVKRRTAKEGLGFVADMPPPTSKKGERNGKLESEKRKKEERVVRIVRGRDVGLKASVVGRIGDDVLVLKVLGSDDKVEVKVDDVAELGSVEEDRCLRKLKDLNIRGRDEEKGSRSKRGEEKESRSKRGRDEVEERRVNSNGGDKEDKGKKQVSWLTSHIRVRVVSRSFKGGRFYLKKGEVLDVIGPTTCDISMDESREIIQGVSQDMLETAIPRRGGPVLVLSGKHKGAFGSLVERDLDREIGTVRDADTHEMLRVKLEHMAEYIGDPSLLGH
ncbi:protein MOS2 [Trifolium pratense]|uniref:protein MOS2 n=1 Tax=Trifolium pratense TaxID=57577 RepID=UPI001E694084|nr:protein MOS2 [Trifolium pratense]XP_045788117.1 protein MOS2 [Trifolium pratense]XP_045788125.1 protein MOS2 [Trifolium pratense]XP_045788134.1 protein MOS2 [Trifolium pratense]XP_045788142.1 protein MOS2 [Trifolium pratense]XP_045788150.1 protein MOS2 [Trifolium pratense]XP_045788157.1 protein MOS2 [Trifolium pratense]XP_045788164.1 protein MOS2 [Trifolium pratense]XP_045788172.1 protein MOS2 [Trifolium pratense]XP_045788182.1 protein MOS2 [Trifolium pratense]